jgi:hypothetical protein
MNRSEPTGSEKALVLRAQAGDSRAVAELFTRFWRAARASASSAQSLFLGQGLEQWLRDPIRAV